MLCPRCMEEAADDSTECPICHKRFSTQPQDHVRVALTGDSYASSPVAPAPATSAAPPPSGSANPTPPPHDHSPAAEAREKPCVRLISARPGLLPAPHSAPKLPRSSLPRHDLRWLIVMFAVVGVVASAILWYRPYVAPVQLAAQITGAGELILNGEVDRPIPAVYLWLWGSYGLLAVATQFLLPAPWRVGPRGMRTNWVLNITTVVTLLMFMGAGATQQAGRTLRGEELAYLEGGGYQYTHGSETRNITMEEAREINTRMIHDQEVGIFKEWNAAAILAYLALGVYAAWWIVERPTADPLPSTENGSAWLDRVLGRPDTLDGLSHPETLPSENARTREPAPGDISWR